jgi:hypothetical protein
VLRAGSSRVGGLSGGRGLEQEVKEAMLVRLESQLTSATVCVSGV